MRSQNREPKIGVVFVLFKTPEKERQRLMLEVINLDLKNYKVYFIDNTGTGKGYAEGVNAGLKKALKDRCELLVVANPDISLHGMTKKNLLAGVDHFDLWGLAMKQQGNVYYGGIIDRWLLTGGLITKKPEQRFKPVDFISGSLMLIKKEVADRIGYFSEEYFMYYEDVDYCLRAEKAGFKVGIDSRTQYEHYELSLHNPKKEKHLAKAARLFFNNYASLSQKIYGIARLPKKLLGGISANGGFVVSFTSLNISSLLNKFLNFILFVFLIRYLEPSEYGIYTLVWAQVSLFSPLVDLGTTTYGIINLPQEKKSKITSLFNLRLAVAIIIFFLTVLLGAYIFRENKRVIVYLLLTSFVIFSNLFSGSYLIKTAVEGKLYNSSLVSAVFNSVLIFSLVTSLLIFKSLPVVFLITFIFYTLYSFINYFLLNKDAKLFTFSIDLPEWKRFIAGSYKYVLIGFLASIYFRIDIFLLQNLKGEAEVGIYSAGYKFFEGLIFIAASYNISRSPMLPKIIKKGRKHLLQAVRKDVLMMSLLGVGTALLFYFVSPIILPLFLKNDYQNSLAVAKLVMLALPFILVSSVFLNIIYVFKKAKIVIWIFFLQAILNFFLNLIFIPKYSYMASAYITILNEVINTALLFAVFRLLIRNKEYENIA